VGRGREPLRAVGPTSALDAVNGNGQLRLGLGEDRPLDDPVLLHTDELFALVEEDELVEGVLDVQLLDDAVLVDLENLDPARDRFVQADVLDGRTLRVERKDRESGEGARLPELERQGLCGCRECLHVRKSCARDRGLTGLS
jgi:hypothetical protein